MTQEEELSSRVREQVLAELCQKALTVQDACNLSGVVHEFSLVMSQLSILADAQGFGTDWKNTHPVAVLYSSKIASLTHSEHPLEFSRAYDFCKQQVGGS